MMLIDTNVLLRLREPDDPHYDDCVEVARRLQDQGGACICAQVMIEYWVVATRPREVNGLGLTTTEAAKDLVRFQKAYACLQEPPDMAARWQEEVTAHAVQGRQAHDARLVALMRAHGINRLLTFNLSDFARYHEITPLTPADVLSR